MAVETCEGMVGVRMQEGRRRDSWREVYDERVAR
jgi:hypothetical protein